jgi:polyphosphate kinase
MSEPYPVRIKWDVTSPELLRSLLIAPLPLRLKAGPLERSFHRDAYYDTADGSLFRRDIWCRLRSGADDRRILTLGLPAADRSGGRERFDSLVEELDPQAALAGASEAARRLRGLVSPATLTTLAELEVERSVRTATRLWPGGKFRLVYDLVAVRYEGLTRGFQELKLRRLRPGAPSLDQFSAALAGAHQLRPILETKLARAQRLRTALETEALARSLGSGRTITLLAVEDGAIALQVDRHALRLPRADGGGEAACRHLLRETFGSAAGDLALLGTAPAPGSLRVQEVWLVRRMRRDSIEAAALEWLPMAELIARAGSPGLDDPETLTALVAAVRSDLLPERQSLPLVEARRSRPLPALASDPAVRLDPDLSLVEFNSRVLALAEDPTTPLLERLNYLAIVSSNLDEFFMVNVGALKVQPAAEQSGRIEAVALRLRALLARQQRCLGECLELMAASGVRVRSWDQLDPAERLLLAERFRTEMFPLLAPRAITMSPGFPVPVIPHLALCLAVLLQDARTGPVHFAYLKIPERLPRFLPVGGAEALVPLEEVIRANLQMLYSDREIVSAHLFRLTRAGDLELAEEDAGNLLQAIEEAVGQRSHNRVVRIEVEQSMPQPVRDRLLWELRFERDAEAGGLSESDVYEVSGMLDLRGLRELVSAPVPGGRFPPFEGRDPLPKGRSFWDLLREGDLLVHHPYDAFSTTVTRFFTEAAEDPDVAAIRLTLYRAGERSPIVEALLRAAAAGKEVGIFVELKARFDETLNAGWVRRLEEAGASVVYGLVGLKNHAKVGLVVRREGELLRRYVHIGTGNYNAATARLYTDLGLFSADPELGADINDLFNQLTGSSHAPAGSYRRLAVAPVSLLPWLLAAIEREIEHARAGRPARIRAKLNGLADGEVVEALYRASREGVEVELVIRGLCTLRPQVPGVSERIRVLSILGRFLEHARIYHFADGGENRYFIGSADWRPRNLRRRIEVIAPVQDDSGRARLAALLDSELSDARAWELQPDGGYLRRGFPGEKQRTSQEELLSRLSS